MFSIVSIKNCNHKSLGIYYLYSSLLFGISGTLCSMILRLEFQRPLHNIYENRILGLASAFLEFLFP